MQLKEERRGGAKNKGEPCEPTLVPLRALTAALGSVPTVALSSASGDSRIARNTREGRNLSTHVTVLIRRLRACESLRLRRQLGPTPGPWPSSARRANDWSGLEPAG